jgi:hypothetical protein
MGDGKVYDELCMAKMLPKDEDRKFSLPDSWPQ